MSKKGKKKSRKQTLTKLTLATSIIYLLTSIIELISKIID